MPSIPPGTVVLDLKDKVRQITDALRPRRSPRAEQPRQTQRAFGPGQPIAPTTDEAEQTGGPRQFQYPVNINVFHAEPRREYNLTPFYQLINLAELYDVAALCIMHRLNELQNLPFAVVAKEKKQQEALQSQCDEAMAFLEKPDGLNDFSAWTTMLAYEMLVTDAMTVYKRQNRKGDLYGLEVVDGTTIKPLIDDRGRTVAYQQVLWGRPFSDYRRPSADMPDEQVLNIYTDNELIYLPRYPRVRTPYGYPPTERVILRVNTALRKQTFDLSYFTEGNVPEAFAIPPEGTMTPTQVEEFEDHFNALLAGNDTNRRRIRFLPWNANIKEMRQFSTDTQVDNFMMRITCSSFSVPPSRLGFTDDINRSTDRGQEKTNQEAGIRSLAGWLKKNLIDPIVQADLGFKDLECRWGLPREEDRLIEARIHQVDIQSGVITPDESRAMRYADEGLEGPAPGPPQAKQQEAQGGDTPEPFRGGGNRNGRSSEGAEAAKTWAWDSYG